MGKNKKGEDGPVQYNIRNSSNFDDFENNNQYDEQPDAEAQLSQQDNVVTYMNETIQAIRSSVDRLNDQEELSQPFGGSDQPLPDEYASNVASQNNSLPRSEVKSKNSNEMLSSNSNHTSKKENKKKGKQEFYGNGSKSNSKVFSGSKQNSKIFGNKSSSQKDKAIADGDEEDEVQDAGFKFQPKKEDEPQATVDDTASTGKQSRGKMSSNSGEKKTGNSQHSLPSSSVTGKYSNAREVSETFTTKLTNMFWGFFALIANVVLLYYFVQMGNGLELPIAMDSVTTIGSVVIEILLLLANFICLKSLNDGAAAFFGHRLSFKKGYSLAVVGFIQTSGPRKFGYCNELSLNSTCRRFLSRISLIWILLELVIILSPFSATSIKGKEVRIDDGYVDCIEFGQKFEPVDRRWPTDETEKGFAELIFGTALGLVRSQNSSLTHTTAVMAPQIVGAVQDGDTMAGDGFVTDIFTTCECTRGDTAGNITEAHKHINEQDATATIAAFNNLTDLGMINHIYFNNSDNSSVVTTFLANFNLCGGQGVKLIQSCVTKFYNHNKAHVEIEYMTDGTPASIAAKAVEIREVKEPADITWVHESLINILNVREKKNNNETLVGSIELPQTVAGITNPLLWWTTPNLIMVDLSLLEAGLETTFTILLRAGMQRTFSTKGDVCVKNVPVAGLSIVTMTPDGIKITCFILGFHLLVSVLAIIAYIPWLLNEDPILPCIRVLKDNIYFSTLLNSSTINTGFYELCNAPSHAMWQAIDIIARVGETIQTVSEEIGHICMDKPKLVRKLVNGKRYY